MTNNIASAVKDAGNAFFTLPFFPPFIRRMHVLTNHAARMAVMAGPIAVGILFSYRIPDPLPEGMISRRSLHPG